MSATPIPRTLHMSLLKIRDMLAFRGPIYEECADIIIDTDELDAGETVDKIIMSVNKSKSS